MEYPVKLACTRVGGDDGRTMPIDRHALNGIALRAQAIQIEMQVGDRLRGGGSAQHNGTVLRDMRCDRRVGSQQSLDPAGELTPCCVNGSARRHQLGRSRPVAFRPRRFDRPVAQPQIVAILRARNRSSVDEQQQAGQSQYRSHETLASKSAGMMAPACVTTRDATRSASQRPAAEWLRQ